MNAAVINLKLESPPLLGEWIRDASGRVVAVICDCGQPLYYRGAVHSRLVDPHAGTALCKRCREMVRVPVEFRNQ